MPRQEEDPQKPHPQRLAGLVKDRPRRDRDLVATAPALLQTPRADEGSLVSATAGAHEPDWPTRLMEAPAAALLIRETILKLHQRLGKTYPASSFGSQDRPPPCRTGAPAELLR